MLVDISSNWELPGYMPGAPRLLALQTPCRLPVLLAGQRSLYYINDGGAVGSYFLICALTHNMLC